MTWGLWRATIVGIIGGAVWCSLYTASAGLLRPSERVVLLILSAAALLASVYWLVLGVL